MAPRPTFQRPEEEDANTVQNLGGLAGGSTLAGPSNTATPTAEAPSATDRFVSFDRLLDANAGNAQRAADNVVGSVTNKVNAAQNALGAGRAAFQERAAVMSPQADGTAAYTGPQDITGQSDWENISNQYADATSAVNALGNRRNGGVNAILGTNAGTGSGRLTGALANAKGGSKFDQLFKNWTTGAGNIMDDTRQAITSTGSMANAANQQAGVLNAKKAEQDRLAEEEAARDRALDIQSGQQMRVAEAGNEMRNLRDRFLPHDPNRTGGGKNRLRNIVRTLTGGDY
jgi:hypothetical protein